jgi:hypothetical protein
VCKEGDGYIGRYVDREVGSLAEMYIKDSQTNTEAAHSRNGQSHIAFGFVRLLHLYRQSALSAVVVTRTTICDLSLIRFSARRSAVLRFFAIYLRSFRQTLGL